MYLLAFHISSFIKYLVKYYAYFLLGYLSFYY